MFNVMATGFKTKAQAEAFIHWYEGQGEQEAITWFECRKDEGKIDVDSMPCDCKKTFPLKWNGDTTKMALKIGKE